MIPRQLGMQRNAAMYSNANVWMQTFDCCCTCTNLACTNLATVLTVQPSNVGGQYPDPVQKRYLFTELLHVVPLCPMLGQMHGRYSHSRCAAVVPDAVHRCSLSFPDDSVLPESAAELAAESMHSGADKAAVLAAPR